MTVGCLEEVPPHPRYLRPSRAPHPGGCVAQARPLAAGLVASVGLARDPVMSGNPSSPDSRMVRRVATDWNFGVAGVVLVAA